MHCVTFVQDEDLRGECPTWVELYEAEKETKMNGDIDIVNLLNDKTGLIEYLLHVIVSADKHTNGLRSMRDRGFSQEGMLEKVIEATAVQSQQLKHLALIALMLTQSDDFDAMVAKMMIKMGRGDEALRAFMNSKLRNGR